MTTTDRILTALEAGTLGLREAIALVQPPILNDWQRRFLAALDADGRKFLGLPKQNCPNCGGEIYTAILAHTEGQEFCACKQCGTDENDWRLMAEEEENT